MCDNEPAAVFVDATLSELLSRHEKTAVYSLIKSYSSKSKVFFLPTPCGCSKFIKIKILSKLGKLLSKAR